MLISTKIHYELFTFSRMELHVVLMYDQASTDVTAACASLRVPLGTVSATDVPSTYFQVGTFGTLRSFIISKKSQGPNFVPWGTPERTGPQSE